MAEARALEERFEAAALPEGGYQLTFVGGGEPAIARPDWARAAWCAVCGQGSYESASERGDTLPLCASCANDATELGEGR